MADPEQIYAEVLSEEQGKGSQSAVAEGRAKAARARAEHGSPHPKEPKWWPGAQPHLEGGGGEVAAEEPAEEAVAEEPAAEEAPAAEAAPAATEEVQAPEVPQEQAPAPAAPVAAPAEPVAVPAAAAAAPVAASAAGHEGVIHGTPTGNRLRPEDEAATEAQFQGQADMYDRRKLIDELIATGVPAVSAHDGGRRSPALALLYLLIPIMAIAFLLANNDSAPAEAAGEGEGGGDTGSVTLVASGVAFETDSITLPADTEATVALDNQDTVPHNFSIYEDDSAEADLFIGPEVGAGAAADNSVPPLEAGEYFFRCDLHPTSMVGTVTVE